MDEAMDNKLVSELALDSGGVTEDVNCVQEGNKRVSSRKRKPNSKYSEDNFVNYDVAKTKKDFDGSTEEASNSDDEMTLASFQKRKPKPKNSENNDKPHVEKLLKEDSEGKKQVTSQKRKKNTSFSEDSEIIPNGKKGILLRKNNLKTNYNENEEDNVIDYSFDSMGKNDIYENTPVVKNNTRKVVGKIRTKKDPFKRNCEKTQTRKLTLQEYPPPGGMLSQLYVAAKYPTKGYNLPSSLFSFFKNHRNSISQVPERSFVPEISEIEGVKESKSKFESGIIVRETNGGDYNDEKTGEDYTPTAVILFFADEDSVPTKSDLHHIFDCYGPLNKVNTEVVKRLKRARVVFKRRSDADMAFKSTGRFSIFGPSLVSYRLSYFY